MALLQRLHRRQVLPTTLQQAWSFFSSPMNLEELTPPEMSFVLLSDPPARIYPGLILGYRIKIMPFLMTEWVTEITAVREPEYFVDEQRAGPYRLWHHEHWFREVPGGVEVEDIVHYTLPFGLAGRLAAGSWVSRRLEAVFAFREEALSQRFPSAGTIRPQPLP